MAAVRSEQLASINGASRRTAILVTIAHVTFRADGISIHLRTDALRRATDNPATPSTSRPDTHDSAPTQAPDRPTALPRPIEVVARLVLARGQTSLVIPGDPVQPRPRADQALVKAIARAVTWAGQLTSGSVASIAEVARAEDVTDKYVHQLLPLAFLDPDIITDLINGRVQTRLTVTDVAKGAAIPAL